MMRALWASSVVAGTLLAPALLHARVPTRLVYVRAPSATDCPDEAALGKAVAARLGYDPFSPWGDQTILATVTREGDDVVGRAELVDHDGISQGSREVKLARRDCGELLLTLSLAISITLDPLQVEAPKPEPGPPPEPSPQAKVEPEPDVADDAPTRPPQSPPQRERLRSKPGRPSSWHLEAAMLGALDAAPGLAFGGRAGVTWRNPRWSLGLEGWGLLPTTREHAEGGEARVRLVSLGFTPCWRALSYLSVCGLGSLGLMHAEGRGVEAPKSDDVLYATLGSRAALSFPLGSRFDLLASLDAAAALNRPRFQLNASDVWRPGPLVVVGGLGVAARFF